MTEKTNVEKIKQRIKDLKEYNEMKQNCVTIALPYGLPDDNFKIHCIVSKNTVKQIEIYNEKLKELMEQKKDQNQREKLKEIVEKEQEQEQEQKQQ